ncbi:MAG: glycine C-acetyltransferase [Deltaproteobacteria bacterium]|jgi:glycine C-acetyltransferase|nr:glycine C-acetyltransferase [Deltaproteobacteria bacterium]MBT4525668.1 glycine C-acetyltransferase [Deltaproteobacteria bacterium]
MTYTMKSFLDSELQLIKANGLFKDERVITSPQKSRIDVATGENVLNMCANNYLGLSNHPDLIKAAQDALNKWGFGLSSVRFICGTQSIHKELEKKVSDFLSMEDTILYSSCFDANGGLFETLLGPEDAIISDELNHASIIDGIRLCKAKRYRYKNCDLNDLEIQLKEATGCRYRLIATDGIFSMDGTNADLKSICDLADKHDALVMVDESHATGVIGKTGKGTPEHCDVMGRVDIITGTFGKALGGASGGFTSSRKEIIDMLRQRSRPYLFSNSLSPSVAAASIQAIDMLTHSYELVKKLHENIAYFKTEMLNHGFDFNPQTHAIIPIMIGEAELAQKMAASLLIKGVYVIGFSFPVVPKGKARIRTQISAVHSQTDLDFAIEKFAETKAEFGLA